jgi:hypothetical protein
MFEALNERLAELVAQQRRKEHAKRRRQEIEKELADAERRRDRMHEAYLAERRDVERLRGMSFGALFLSLIGKREQRLSREEEEMLQAKLRLDEAEEAVKELAAERDELKRLEWKLADVEAKMAEVLAEKEKRILEHQPELAAALRELTDREANEGAAEKELREAVHAGKIALRELNRSEELLRSARNWGVYDMLGGGIISTAIKHNRIDEARSALRSAEAALKRFRTELKDVARDIPADIKPDLFLTVGDYLFDGLIFDWIVQGKIGDGLDRTRRQVSRVRHAVNELERALGQTRARLDDLRRQRDALIRQA